MACVPPFGPLANDAPEMQEARELGVTLVKAIATKPQFEDQLANQQHMRDHFAGIMPMVKDMWQHEFAYYTEKGWL